MEIALSRTKLTAHSTIGEVRIDGDLALTCYSLEDVVREVADVPVAEWKVPGNTAIPAGKYKIIVNRSARFKQELPLLLDVEGFTGIRIHSGNTDADTEGCIIVGYELTPAGDAILGGTSRPALNRLVDEIVGAINAREEVWITVSNDFQGEALGLQSQ